MENIGTAAVIERDYDEFDPEVAWEAAMEGNSELSEDLYAFPKDYVVGIVGVRGSGKSARLARTLIKALKENKNVFTNLMLFPELLGIKNKPYPLDLKQLVSFDPILNEGVIGIDEIGTWVHKRRSMSTSTILIEEFLQQLRKRRLRIFCTTQIKGLLPTDVDFQMDKLVIGHDACFTQYGRENNMPRGVNFFGWEIDKSGIFTGKQNWRWPWSWSRARNIWRVYDSYQTFEIQFGKKIKFKGGEQIFDLDTKEMYSADEKDMRDREQILANYGMTLKHIWRSWQPSLLKLASEGDAIIKDTPDRVVISIMRLEKALSEVKGKTKKSMAESYADLRTLAGQHKIARFADGLDQIELLKPFDYDKSN